METVRTVENFELIYEPLMRMYRVIDKKSEELSMWFDSETANELKEMSEDEFVTTSKQYIGDASYAE